jgi:D-amino-acid dehydrogenase
VNPRKSSHSDILVIGGGVIGLACAYYLARAGRSVRIVEQDTMGAGASHGNCGIVFVSDLPPLCAPGAVGHELVRLLKGTSPLYIKPRADLSLAFWLLRFAAKSNRHHLHNAIRAREAILRASNDLLRELMAEEELACEFEHRGILMVFSDPKAMAAYAETNRLLEPFGLAATLYGRREVRRIEPTLSERVCGAWHHRADSCLRPELLMSAWTRAARRRAVEIDEGCRLNGFETHNGKVTAAQTTAGRFTADRFVLAAGAWSADLTRRIGVRIPVQPGKGYSITMERPAVCPRIPCYLYEPNVVVTPWQSGYRLGGTMEFSGFDRQLNEKRLGHLETATARYFKTAPGRRATERWAGLRPMSADDLPIIDRLPAFDNLYLATGHGMLGISTATGTGRLIADMIQGNRPPFDPAPFSMRRFG